MRNEYLTENLLGDFLKERISNNIIRDTRLLDTNFRPDFVLPDFNLIVEFDGFLHYTKANIILADYKKDSLYKKYGFKVIRIPYFIQLDSYVIKKLFKKYTNNSTSFNNFPHGFIDKKVVYPADFCSLGIKRFIKDLNKYKKISDQILKSLTDKIIEQNKSWEYFVPEDIYKIL